jgi:beta-glucosidase
VVRDAWELRLLVESGRWTVEPGEYQLLVGASSRDIRLRGGLAILEDTGRLIPPK